MLKVFTFLIIISIFFSCKDESKKLALVNVDAKKSTIIFEENFDKNALDEAYWNYDLGNGCPNLCGWGNNERQIYTKENVNIKDGYLIIKATKDSLVYKSAKITTKQKVEFIIDYVKVLSNN